MLLLKSLQHLHLLLLLARRLAHLLLPLVVHHLLHHRARLPVQIAQLAVLRRDLGRVDLGRRRDDMRPPFHLVHFVHVDADFLAGVRGGGRGGVAAALQSPGGFVNVDWMREWGLWFFSSVSVQYLSLQAINWAGNR